MGKFHPLQPAYLADPYPYLARLRASEPIYYSPDMQGYVLTRYRDCAAVLRDDEHFSSDPATESGGMGQSVRGARACAALGDAPVLANSDGPVHAHLRDVLAEAFRARNLMNRRESLEPIVSNLVDSIEPGKPVDLMKLLCEPLPLVALLDYLGIPAAERDEFRHCVVGIMRGRMDGYRDGAAAQDSHRAAAALRALVARSGQTAGVLAQLQSCVETGGLAEDEMLMLLVHVATAGNAATAFATGNGLLAFARNPEAWARLRADPSLLPGAVEECLRYDSPTHITSRFALDGAEVAGRRIPAGRAVHLVVSAANRDPEAFPEPDSFEITRKQERQVAFGMGPHFCLGAPLGRLEMEVGFSALLARFERLALVPGGYEPGGTLYLRGPRRLVVSAC